MLVLQPDELRRAQLCVFLLHYAMTIAAVGAVLCHAVLRLSHRAVPIGRRNRSDGSGSRWGHVCFCGFLFCIVSLYRVSFAERNDDGGGTNARGAKGSDISDSSLHLPSSARRGLRHFYSPLLCSTVSESPGLIQISPRRGRSPYGLLCFCSTVPGTV
ncbi:hypothetical protein K438DRAFT_757026 [Mycena galopus ATCC 62051]|nr:hypothetical protein K438DRAFT_757026 [Mycena galopus ATCC 62051]